MSPPLPSNDKHAENHHSGSTDPGIHDTQEQIHLMDSTTQWLVEPNPQFFDCDLLRQFPLKKPIDYTDLGEVDDESSWGELDDSGSDESSVQPTAPRWPNPTMHDWIQDSHVLILPLLTLECNAAVNYGPANRSYSQSRMNVFLALLSQLGPSDAVIPSPSDIHHTHREVDRPRSVAFNKWNESSTQGFLAMVHTICCDAKGPHDWAALWQTVAGRYKHLRSEGRSVSLMSYVAEQHINYSRCSEYDDLVKSLSECNTVMSAEMIPSDDVLPYRTSWEDVSNHSIFLIYILMDPPTGSHAMEREDMCALTTALDYAQKASSENRELRRIYKFDLPATIYTHEEALEARVNMYRERLGKYPVAGTIDAAIAVAVDGAWPSECSQTFMNDFLFFCGGSKDEVACPPQVLHLPLLLISHDRSGTQLSNVTQNQRRLACVSAVRFLAVLGIKDFPVYGLATYGPYASLCQVWYSESKCCYIVDQVAEKRRFDVSTEQGTLRYTGFLCKLEEQAQVL